MVMVSHLHLVLLLHSLCFLSKTLGQQASRAAAADSPSSQYVAIDFPSPLPPSLPNSLKKRAGSTCPADNSTACGQGLPSDICCSPGTVCTALNAQGIGSSATSANSTAVCCPAGTSCAYIRPITCDIQQLNVTASPNSPILTTNLGQKLATCNEGCCPPGYVCHGQGCVVANEIVALPAMSTTITPGVAATATTSTSGGSVLSSIPSSNIPSTLLTMAGGTPTASSAADSLASTSVSASASPSNAAAAISSSPSESSSSSPSSSMNSRTMFISGSAMVGTFSLAIICLVVWLQRRRITKMYRSVRSKGADDGAYNGGYGGGRSSAVRRLNIRHLPYYQAKNLPPRPPRPVTPPSGAWNDIPPPPPPPPVAYSASSSEQPSSSTQLGTPLDSAKGRSIAEMAQPSAPPSAHTRSRSASVAPVSAAAAASDQEQGSRSHSASLSVGGGPRSVASCSSSRAGGHHHHGGNHSPSFVSRELSVASRMSERSEWRSMHPPREEITSIVSPVDLPPWTREGASQENSRSNSRMSSRTKESAHTTISSSRMSAPRPTHPPWELPASPVPLWRLEQINSAFEECDSYLNSPNSPTVQEAQLLKRLPLSAIRPPTQVEYKAYRPPLPPQRQQAAARSRSHTQSLSHEQSHLYEQIHESLQQAQQRQVQRSQSLQQVRKLTPSNLQQHLRFQQLRQRQQELQERREQLQRQHEERGQHLVVPGQEYRPQSQITEFEL